MNHRPMTMLASGTRRKGFNMETTYTLAVQAALTAQGQVSALDVADSAVVQAGQRYGVGPYDCAAQVMANRFDARIVSR